MWPRSAVLWLVDKISSTQCLKVSWIIENTRYIEQQKISRTKENTNSKAKKILGINDIREFRALNLIENAT